MNEPVSLESVSWTLPPSFSISTVSFRALACSNSLLRRSCSMEMGAGIGSRDGPKRSMCWTGASIVRRAGICSSLSGERAERKREAIRFIVEKMR